MCMYMHCRTIRRDETRYAGSAHDSCWRLHSQPLTSANGQEDNVVRGRRRRSCHELSIHNRRYSRAVAFAILALATFQCLELGRAWLGCLLQVTGGGSTAMHRAGYRASEGSWFCCSSHAGVCTPSAAGELVAALAALVRGGGARERRRCERGQAYKGDACNTGVHE